jgi:peptide/nickel transport system substrate-binding protein
MKKQITRLLALTLCVAMLLALVGCGGKKASDEEVIYLSLEADPLHLDESLSLATTTRWSAGPVNDYLFAFDEDMNLEKRLVEEYNMADELTLELKIREGVKFHNGREVKASDVKFSIERQLDETVASEIAYNFTCIDSVEVVDDYSAIVHLNEPYASLLTKLARIAIVPEECADTLKTAPVGCGPFKFVEWKHDQSIELEAFEDYWQEGYPKADRLIFKILPEYNSQRAALMAGEIDILTWLNSNDVAELENNEKVKVNSIDIQDAYYVLLNCDVEPFNDPLVRKAISLAIDKQTCLDVTMAGYGDVLHAPVPSSSYYFDDSLKFERDVEKAKELLAEAGYADGFTCKLVTPQTAVEGPLGDLIQAQLAEVGITVEVEKMEVNAYLDKTFAKRDFEIMVCGDSGDGDPETLAYSYLFGQSPNNLGNYQNPEFDQLMTEGRATYDPELRREIYLKAFTLLMEDSPMTFLFGGKIYQGLAKDIEGFAGDTTQRYIYEGVYRNSGE